MSTKIMLAAALLALAGSAGAQAQLGSVMGHRVAATVTPGGPKGGMTVEREEVWDTGESRTTSFLPDGSLRQDGAAPSPAKPVWLVRNSAIWSASGLATPVDFRLEFHAYSDGYYLEPGRNWDDLHVDVGGRLSGRRLWFNTYHGYCDLGIETPAPGLLKSDDSLFEMVDLTNDTDLYMRAHGSDGFIRDDQEGAVKLDMPELAKALAAACALMARTHDVSYAPMSYSLPQISGRVNDPYVLDRLTQIAAFAASLDVLHSPLVPATLQVEAKIGNVK